MISNTIQSKDKKSEWPGHATLTQMTRQLDNDVYFIFFFAALFYFFAFEMVGVVDGTVDRMVRPGFLSFPFILSKDYKY